MLTVDPGTVGAVAQTPLVSRTIPANDRVVEIVFADMKHVEVLSFGYQNVALGTSFRVDFWLTDERGQEIPGTRNNAGGGPGFLRSFGNDPVIAHDVHYEFTGTEVFDIELVAIGLVGEWEVEKMPEPATLLLFGLGLLGLTLATRKK